MESLVHLAGGFAVVAPIVMSLSTVWTAISALAAANPIGLAVVGMTRALAREWGPEHIRVNCIIPGWIMTERQQTLWLTPEADAMRAKAQALPDRIAPAEVARLALFLASDDSRMCTGQEFTIDPGWSM